MKTSVLLALPVAALWSLTSLSAQQVERRIALAPTGTVEISIVSGSLQIRDGAQGGVHISGTIGDESKLEVEGEADHVKIKVVLPREDSGKKQAARLVLELPAKVKLQTSTVSAETQVRGMQGSQELRSVSGDITTELGGEDLNAGTVSGAVQAHGDGSAAHVTVSSVSGNVTLANIGGYVDVTSVSGKLALQLTTLANSKLRTTSGNIELSGALRNDARIDIESTSGEVAFKISGQRDVEYELVSFSGDIDSCLGAARANKNKFGPGSQLRFTEGKGSARVNVNTLSGDIKLCN